MDKLPQFELIDIKKVPNASSLVFLDWKESMISWYSRHRIPPKWDYKQPAPCHEAIKLIGDKFLNVNKFCTIEDLEDRCFKSTRMILTIIRKDLSDQQRQEIVEYSMGQEDSPKIGFNLPTYPIIDLLRFEPLLKWIPNNKNHYFCSERNSHIFNRFSLIDSNVSGDKSAPFHKILYALQRPEIFDIKTVWVGKDYNKKYSIV